MDFTYLLAFDFYFIIYGSSTTMFVNLIYVLNIYVEIYTHVVLLVSPDFLELPCPTPNVGIRTSHLFLCYIIDFHFSFDVCYLFLVLLILEDHKVKQI